MPASQLSNSDSRAGVWDLPTRIFHWTLVLLVTLSITTGLVGGDSAMTVHQWSGMGILSLVLFRIVWGIVGGRHARFAGFLRGPVAVVRYAGGLLKKDSVRFHGHNPLGGWSVVLMLLCLAVQAVTGLFANDDASFEGPLTGHVSKATSDFLTHIHDLNIDVLYVLLGLHIVAVLFYLVVKRDNLIVAMITGWKRSSGGAAGPAAAAAGPAADNWRGSSVAAAAILAVAMLVVWLVTRA